MIRIGLSNSSVFPKSIETCFRLAAEAGFDGVETMVSTDAVSRDAAQLEAFATKYDIPVLSIHAPVLLVSQFVWGRDQAVKLRRTAEFAADLGAETVVVHPPFRWQKGYAERFLDTVREIHHDTGITMAVENMFPWTVQGQPLKAYLPGTDPTEMDCDAICLDFSHAALSGQSALEMAKRAGPRLHHVHLCDGQGPDESGKMFDEHLLPGHGGQPVAETLEWLREGAWEGLVVAEVKTHRAKSEAERLGMLLETVEFAREHLGLAAH